MVLISSGKRIATRITRREVLARFGLAGLGYASLPLILNSEMAEAAGDKPRRGGVLKFGMETPVFGLDPHIEQGAGQAILAGMTHSRLLQLNDDWSGFEPDLALKWETSPDGRTYTFHLRPNVKFHDGSVMTAEDVVFSFERMTTKANGAYVGSLISDWFEQVTAPNSSTVQFAMKAPFAAFLSILTLPSASIISKKWVTGGGDLHRTQMGTGPMKFVSMEPNSKATLTRNAQYYDPSLPYLDGVTLLFLPDETSRSVALRNGSVDFIDFVPWREMAAIKSDPKLRLYTDTDSSGIWAIFNVQRPPLDNVMIRRSINWAVNREAVMKVAFFGRGAPMLNTRLPKTSWAYSPDLPKYGYDPDRAKSLIKESGLKMPLHLDILSDSDDLFWKTSSEVVHGNLQDVGFDVKLNTPEYTQAAAQENAMNFEIGWRGGAPAYADPDYMYAFFHSRGAVGHLMGYHNPELDGLLESARTTVDRNVRRSAYMKASKILFDAAPWLPLAFREQGEASAAYVRGYRRTLGTSWNGPRVAKVWLAK